MMSMRIAARRAFVSLRLARNRGPLPALPHAGLYMAGALTTGAVCKPACRTLCSASSLDGNLGSAESQLSQSDIMIYQYKICPFCNKVKAVLDYLKVPYNVTEVNPLTKKELKFSADYKKVPIVRIDGHHHRDSSEIVNTIIGKLSKPEELGEFYSKEAQEWMAWADSKLAVLLFPNITRSFGESYQAFSYVESVDSFSALDKLSNRVVGSTAMWLAQGKIKAKYAIEDEREALVTALREWIAQLQDKKFAGGDKPHVGDISVYACLKAIEGLDTHKEVLQHDDVLRQWYVRMDETMAARQ